MFLMESFTEIYLIGLNELMTIIWKVQKQMIKGHLILVLLLIN